jgi:2-polyprenyl-6-methoxyphenol hydroxylase-like FAD-dependent oxidoreductase
MNSGFEDCAELDALITKYDHDWKQIFSAYERARKPNGDAIAELSKRNFIEMSDLSGDKNFQLQKKIEAISASKEDRSEIQRSISGALDAAVFNGDIFTGRPLFGGAPNGR